VAPLRRWRLFAMAVALLLAATALLRPVQPAPGSIFEIARTAYWLLAPLGLLGYAFGFRVIGVTFWRFYAVIFTFEINWRFVRLVREPSSPHPTLLVAVVWLAAAMMCLALLRHAELIGAKVRQNGVDSPVVRSRPRGSAAASFAQPMSSRVGADAKRLNYNRKTLFGVGILFLALGSVMLLTIVGPLEGRHGRALRLLVAAFGEDGARICLAAISMLACVGGLRLLWLLRRGGLAIRFDSAGITARAIFGSLTIPWSSVQSLEIVTIATTRGLQRAVVVHHSCAVGLPLRLVGLRDKIAIPHKLAAAEDADIDAWLAAAREQAASSKRPNGMPPRLGGFGRKR
jgi:hypothetical protein